MLFKLKFQTNQTKLRCHIRDVKLECADENEKYEYNEKYQNIESHGTDISLPGIKIEELAFSVI
jgi:hypothetical protein